MVQIKENWTDIEGSLISLDSGIETDRFSTVQVKVSATASVLNFTSFLEDTMGKTIIIHVPKEIVHRMKFNVGSQIKCRIRKTESGQIYLQNQNIEVSE